MLMMGTYAAGGIYIWPRSLSLVAGQNAEIALGLSVLWATAIFAGVTYWARHAPGPTVVEKLTQTLGPFFGWVVLGVSGSLTMVYLGAISALYLSVVTTIILPGNRVWSVALFLSGFTFWMANRPAVSIVRMITLSVPGLALLTFLVGILGIHLARYPGALLPHFPVHWARVGEATVQGVFFWIPILPLATLTSMLRPVNRAKVVRVTVVTMGIQGIILLGLYMLATSTLGPQGIVRLTWPMVFVYENIDLSNFFISQIGFFVAIIWTVTFAGFFAWHVWHQSLVMEGLWRAPRGALRPAVVMVMLVILLVVLGFGLKPLGIENVLRQDLCPLYFWSASVWVSLVVLRTVADQAGIMRRSGPTDGNDSKTSS